MEKEQILKSQFLDILFENRNKDYGAYVLRKTYNSRLFQSLLMMMGGLILVILYIHFFVTFNGNDNILAKQLAEEGISYRMMEIEKKIEPHTIQKKAVAGAGSKILMVDDFKVPKNLLPPLSGSNIGTIDGPEIINPDLIGTIGEPITPIGSVPPDISHNAFVPIMKEAVFPGGDNAWRIFLQNNLMEETPVNNGAPAGTYRVIVRFSVNAEGKISDVVAETNFGYGMEEEAIRVIKLGPKWLPAQQNDHKLTSIKRQPITFLVQEQ